LAFVGFRHGHINDLYSRASALEEVEIVAACEEDAGTRDAMKEGDIEITHSSYPEMLSEVECDIVAVGDYYGARGGRLIEALRLGKHVTADKPICTSLAELAEIDELSREKNLSVGCMLDLRDSGFMLRVRELISSGAIGSVQAISFGGQHPLNYTSRPPWYFEKGKHGGTLNDIAIHAMDAIPWLTGQAFTTVNAARCWNALIPDVPHFEDCAQVMLTLANGGGVLGDVSYLSPDSFGYSVPYYWRITVWGDGGVLEAGCNIENITLHRKGASEPEVFQPLESCPGGYLQAFLSDIDGESAPGQLNTADVLRAAYVTLKAQEAADKHLTNVAL
jgi:predicted dehydrogenase